MSKKFFLIGAIVWIIVAAVALTLLLMGLGGTEIIGGRFMRGSDNYKLVKQESFTLDEINELFFGTRYHNLNITLTDGDEMRVSQYDKDEKNLFFSQVENGTLSVEVDSRIELFNFFEIYADPRLEVELPRGYAKMVQLRSSSGTISVDGAPVWGTTTIKNSSGEVYAEALTCAALDVSSSSGSINIGEIDATSVSVSASSGSLRLDRIRVVGEVYLKSNSGSIQTGGISSGECSVSSSSGSLRLGAITAKAGLSIQSFSGSIHTDSLSAANIMIKSTSGTIEPGDIDSSGELSITSSSGSHHAGYVRAGQYKISSSSGGMQYGGVSGSGKIETSSASISVGALDIRGEVSIISSSGTQRLTLDREQSFEVTIETNSGMIRADSLGLMYADRNGRSAFGSVGGGEGSLYIRTTSGSVTIS